MNHYIITNRPTIEKKEGGFRFAKEGRRISSTIYFGNIEISNDEPINYDLFGAFYKENPDFSYNSVIESEEGVVKFFKEIFLELRTANPENANKNDVLVFIHGYGHSVNKSFRFLKALHKKYVLNPNCSIKKIIMLMWPSKAHGVSYFNERTDAEYTGNLMGNFYMQLRRFIDEFGSSYDNMHKPSVNGKLHLMAQSMGNKVLEKLFLHVNYASTSIRQTFSEIVMVGADLENNIFEEGQSLEKLPAFCDRIHVYVHKQDFGLKISKLFNWLNEFRNRQPLGKTGPDNIFFISERIKVVDVTKVEDCFSRDSEDLHDFLDDNIIQHRYFMYSRAVVEDITRVLNGVPSEQSDVFKNRIVKYEGRWFNLLNEANA